MMSKKEIFVGILMILLLVFFLINLCNSVTKLERVIENRGVKSIVTELWEGKQ